MLRLLSLLTVFTLLGTGLSAQNTKSTGSVKGIITSSDGKPAAYITVQIDGKWGGVSNEKGEYLVRNIKPGEWTIRVSAVAMVSQEKTITVTAGGTSQVDFVLAENAEQLEEVTISNQRLNKETRFVAKMPLTNLENPQVYNTVSSEIMKQQAITNYDDAMRNVPGITRTWESTGRAGDGAAYFALRGFDAQPTLYNGLPGLVSGNLDPANIEEIQVLKGPSGTLFGGAFYSYGGMINTVTKKPYHSFGGEIGYNFGSFGLNRITADINTPLSKTEKIALRINTSYHSENSFQDAGFKKSFFIAPSLSYEVNNRLSFLVNAEILEEERAVPPVFFHSDRSTPLPFKTIKELGLNNDVSFTSNDLTIKNPRYNLQGQMLYKLSDKWNSQTVFSRGSVKSSGIYTYIWDDAIADNYFDQFFNNQQQTTNTIDIQQNFNGDFKTGMLRHRLLIGLDYFNRNVIDNGSGWVAGRKITPQSGEVEYTDPATNETTDPVFLSRSYIDQLLAGAGANNSNITNSSYSAYASDVINFTPALAIMASLRADYFDSKGQKNTKADDYDQFALSPKLGVVFQPVLDKVSLFANYMNAFINVAPGQIRDANGIVTGVQSFKPEQANQWEAGAKVNLFGDKLFATASYYDIRVSDRVVGDGRGNSIQGGEVGSKGFELDLTANPVDGLNLIAGYSHNQAKIIEGDKTDFYSQPGRAPGGQGPQNLANLWATYKFTSGKLKNFGIGLGGNYGSEYKVIDNDVTGVFNLPSYTLINGSLFYNARHFRASCNVNNITGEEYYIGYWSVNPQKPRNFTVSFAYKF